MSVTQIVGPRIAPYWADPVEWTSTRAYEPFTFVTYQGDSYCSRQDTPIGIDIKNDDYWVKVSDYNAQAVALQRSMTQTIETAETNMSNTVQTAKNNLTDVINTAKADMNQSVSDVNTAINTAKTDMNQSVADVQSVKEEFQTQLDNVSNITPIVDYLRNKKAVMYGDSTAALGPTYSSMITSLCGMQITNRAISGTAVTSGPKCLLSLMNEATKSTFDGFDYCFLAYSTNDYQGNIAMHSNKGLANGVISFQEAFETAIDKIQTLNPSIQIVFIAPAYVYRNTTGSYLPNINYRGFTPRDYVEMAKNVCSYKGVAFIDLALLGVNENNMATWMIKETDIDVYVHYQTALKQKIAQFIVNAFPWSVPAPISYDSGTLFENILPSQMPSSTYLNNTVSNLQSYVGGITPDIKHSVLIKPNSSITLENVTLTPESRLNYYCVHATTADDINIYLDNNTKNIVVIGHNEYGHVSVPLNSTYGNHSITIVNKNATKDYLMNGITIGNSIFSFANTSHVDGTTTTFITNGKVDSEKSYITSGFNQDILFHVVTKGSIASGTNQLFTLNPTFVNTTRISIFKPVIPVYYIGGSTFYIAYIINRGDEYIIQAPAEIPDGTIFNFIMPYNPVYK